MTSVELVLAFIEAARRALALLRENYAGVERAARRGLVAYPRSGGDGIRSGPLGDGGEFSLHGIGCLFDLASGETVDIDWNQDGEPIFDAFRLQAYARSVGQRGRWTDQELRDAASWLVSAGELNTGVNGWFAIRGGTA